MSRDLVSAVSQIGRQDAWGSVLFIKDIGRFKPIPEANQTPFLGIGKNGAVWDNYELGLDIFPLVARSAEDRKFIYAFREAATFDLNRPRDELLKKLTELEALLNENHKRFDVLLVWNQQPEFAEILARYFEDEPYFTSGQLRLYRHR